MTYGGVTIGEFTNGKNSGWMYRVNGVLVGRYMSAQGLKDGDRIELYFTSDWTSEPGAEGWQKPDRIETIVNADGSTADAFPQARRGVGLDGGEYIFQPLPPGRHEIEWDGSFGIDLTWYEEEGEPPWS